MDLQTLWYFFHFPSHGECGRERRSESYRDRENCLCNLKNYSLETENASHAFTRRPPTLSLSAVRYITPDKRNCTHPGRFLWYGLFNLTGVIRLCFTSTSKFYERTNVCLALQFVGASWLSFKILYAPWYVLNTVIRRDLQIPTVKEEIRRYSSQYSARLSAHPNDLIVNLMELPDNRRLRRHLPNDLPYQIPSVIVVFAILVFKV
jgi:hypothetical protein